MTRIRFDNVGRVGIISDTPAHELPPEAWTGGFNVRMVDGAVWKSFGHEKILDPPGIPPLRLYPTATESGAQIYAYPGVGKVHATDGTTHADITRLSGDYIGTIDDQWNGGSSGLITILNNGADVPQAWIGPALATRLVDLANWPANTLAKVIRPFGRFWVAYDVTVSGVRSAQLVKWSERAAPNTIPPNWDFADPTSRSGEWPLAETDGAIVDALSLGGVNFVYKEDEVHAMEEIAGNFVFSFRRRFGQIGLLAQRCVKLYQKGESLVHIVMSHDDIVQHDGFQMDSLLDNRMRRWYAGRNDLSKASRCWLAPNYAEDEMWAGIVEAGEEFPNLALILNLKDGTSTIQEIPNVAHIAWAAFDPTAGATTFDAQTTPFDQMVGQFGQRNFSPGRKRLLMVVPGDFVGTSRFLLADQGFQREGTSFPARIERRGLAMIGQDRQGNMKADTEIVKLVTELWPRVRTLNGETIGIQVGAHDKLEGPITWNPEVEFNVNTMDKIDVDPPVSGRFIAVRFATTGDVLWKLDGYDLELHPLGKFNASAP